MRVSVASFVRRRWKSRGAAAVALVAVLLSSQAGISGDEPEPNSSSATYSQASIIDCCREQGDVKLQDFCTSLDGNVLALVVKAPPTSFRPVRSGFKAATAKAKDAKADADAAAPDLLCQVLVFDAAGKQSHQWPVSFEGQAINVSPDGSVYVGGAGRLAQYDRAGKVLAEGPAPQTAFVKDPDALRKAAEEELASEKELYQQTIDQFKEQIEEAEKAEKKTNPAKKATSDEQPAEAEADPVADSPSEADEPIEETEEGENDGILVIQSGRNFTDVLKQQVKQLQRQIDAISKKSIDDVVREITAKTAAINAIAASDKAVYVVCRAAAGYGYELWRTDLDFSNGQKIVSGLVGCCGQMDVQVRGDELWVAENSRHRVVRFDRDGKELMSFGRRDRDGDGDGFSGCCNPMNLCFTAAGDVLVSESNGVVKRFDKEGKFRNQLGVAQVTPGCKNSAVGVSPDEKHVFYIDIKNSKVIVLARNVASAETEGE